ncbi:MAG: hypothetical protein E7633_04780 [Ruminococcaceae bacterium]|nr:hypothetical protein [Oscillospiraceae bacterium]
MKKKINPIWFLIGILAIFVGIPIGIFLYFYIGIQLPLISESFYDYRYVWIVAIAGLLSITIFSFILLPIVLFLIKRIICYFSLWFVCKKNGLAFKITRFPLASLWGISEKEDIKVSASDENYCVHFIDMVFRARRGFTLINEKEYCIAQMRVEMRGFGGGFIKGKYSFPMVFAVSSTPKAYTTYAFPDFDDSKGKHIIIVHPTPNHVLYIDKTSDKDGKSEIHSGYSVGNITYYEAEDFVKLLKQTH